MTQHEYRQFYERQDVRVRDADRDERYPEELDYRWQSHIAARALFDFSPGARRRPPVEAHVLALGRHPDSLSLGLSGARGDGGRYRDVALAVACDDVVGVYRRDLLLDEDEIVRRFARLVAYRIGDRVDPDRDCLMSRSWLEAGSLLHHAERAGQVERVPNAEDEPRRWRITRLLELYTIEGEPGRSLRTVDRDPADQRDLEAAWREDRQRQQRQRRNLVRRLDTEIGPRLAELGAQYPHAIVTIRSIHVGGLPASWQGQPIRDHREQLASWHRQAGRDARWTFSRLQAWQGAVDDGYASDVPKDAPTVAIEDADALGALG